MLIDYLNVLCNNIDTIYLKVGDESTSVIRFGTTSKGSLPHLYYILHKLKPLGTEFNTMKFSVTGDLILL